MTSNLKQQYGLAVSTPHNIHILHTCEGNLLDWIFNCVPQRSTKNRARSSYESRHTDLLVDDINEKSLHDLRTICIQLRSELSKEKNENTRLLNLLQEYYKKNQLIHH